MKHELLKPENFQGRKFDRYTPQEVLGATSRSLVFRATDRRYFRARDSKVPSEVALKISTPVGHDAEAFKDETEIHAYLTPIPGVIPLRRSGYARYEHFDTVRKPGDLIVPEFPFLVTMLASKGSLEMAIRQGGPLSVDQVVDYGVRAFTTLEGVHDSGFMHLDIKPGNLFLDEEASGKTKLYLGDFGAARRVLDLPQGAGVPTKQGRIEWTPGYAPPEQVEGFPTVWSDVFAGAATIWAMMTGEDPFAQGRLVVPSIEHVLGDETSSKAKALDRILHAAMSPEPVDRQATFGSVSGFTDALRDLLPSNDRNTVHIDLGEHTEASRRLQAEIEALRTTKHALAAEIADERRAAEAQIAEKLAGADQLVAEKLSLADEVVEGKITAANRQAAARLEEADDAIAAREVAADEVMADAEIVVTGQHMEYLQGRKKLGEVRDWEIEDAYREYNAQQRAALDADVADDLREMRIAEAASEAGAIKSALQRSTAEDPDFAVIEAEIAEEASQDRQHRAQREEMRVQELAEAADAEESRLTGVTLQTVTAKVRLKSLVGEESIIQGRVLNLQGELVELEDERLTILSEVQMLEGRGLELASSIQKLEQQRAILVSKKLPEITDEIHAEDRTPDPLLMAELEDPMIQRAKEILGEDFLGVEAVNRVVSALRGVGEDVKFIFDELPEFPYTETDLQAAKELGEMIVLRPFKMFRINREVPLALDSLVDLFRGEYDRTVPRIEYRWIIDDERGRPNNISTILNCEAIVHQVEYSEDQYPSYALVSKRPIPGTRGKYPHESDSILGELGSKLVMLGANNCQVRQRTSVEAVWDAILFSTNSDSNLRYTELTTIKPSVKSSLFNSGLDMHLPIRVYYDTNQRLQIEIFPETTYKDSIFSTR